MSSTSTLNNNIKIPTVGFGTSRIPAGEVEDCVRQALEAGYRHIDTARVYRNETLVGNALKQYFKSGKLQREDVFITSKLSPLHLKPEDVLPELENSLACLQLEYLDMYLIHFPMAIEDPQSDLPYNFEKDYTRLISVPIDHHETWKAMENLVSLGKVKSIGISNFNSVQLEAICKKATILPVTNQVEIHARHAQVELQRICEKYNILLTAYAPLGSPGFLAEEKPLFQESIILDLAKSYNKTPAQILLRNLVQRGIIVIPKTANSQRMKENIEIFDFHLHEEDMKKIEALNTNQRLFPYKWMADFLDYPFKIPF